MLWSAWEEALLAPDRFLEELAGSDEERLLAHIEGLVAGGETVARELLLPTLTSKADPEEAFASALALLSGHGGQRHLGAIFEAVVAGEDEVRSALVRALELAPLFDAGAFLIPGLTHAEPAVRAAAGRALAFRSADLTQHLPALLKDEDAGVRETGNLAAQGPGGAVVLPTLARALDDPSPGVRWTALEAGVIHGLEPARARCLELAAKPGQGAALRLLALWAGPDALAPIAEALDRPSDKDRDDALIALGHLGLQEGMALVIPYLEGPDRAARLAAEAICVTTGLNMDALDMIRAAKDAEPDEPVPLDEEDLDKDLVPSPADLLPLPRATDVARWWGEQSSRYAAGQRHVGGMPASVDTLRGAMLTSPMRRHHTFALALAVLTKGRVFPETRTWGRAQLQQLIEARWPAS